MAELGERIGQTRKQLAGLAQLSASLKRQLDLIAREISVRRSLFEKGLTQLHILLGLEREDARLNGQAGEAAVQTAQLNLAIAEIEVQILQVDAQHLEDAEAQARETHAQEIQVLEQIAAIQDRLGSMNVRAPVSGEVFALAVFAPNEVVSAGEPILYLVPEDAGLLVVAKLDPSDVDQVFAGQDTVLRFTAFPARATPYFDGRVLWVSPDVLSDSSTGLEWYNVEIEISGGRPAADFPLEPGMPVEAHIRTSDRSPLDYLMKPLTDHFARALREQ